MLRKVFKIKQPIKHLTIFFALILTWTPIHLVAQVSIESISPNATDVTEEVPALGGRLSSFAWRGVAGTDYIIQISISQEPALVVGVGARINSTSFDEQTSLLEVDLRYEGSAILSDDNVELPDSVFLIALDPGIEDGAAQSETIQKKDKIEIKANDTRKCYGPGSDPQKYVDSSNDFGDEEGLIDPKTPSTDDQTVGLPSSAPGSYLSTNSFYWCIIPASRNGVDVGFKAHAKSQARDSVSFFLSVALLDKLSSNAGKDFSADTLALFSGGVQASLNIEDQDGGVIAFADLLFIEGEISLNDSFFSTSSLLTQTSFSKQNATVSASKLVTRSFSFGEDEDISFAPETLRPSGRNLDFFGFVDEEEFIGGIVEIVRLQNRLCDPIVPAGLTQKRAVSVKEVKEGVVVARGVVQPNGSYQFNVPTSVLFPNNANKSNLVARIIGDQVQQSRQISLTNRSRANRR